jgi:hypothetical protein
MLFISLKNEFLGPSRFLFAFDVSMPKQLAIAVRLLSESESLFFLSLVWVGKIKIDDISLSLSFSLSFGIKFFSVISFCDFWKFEISMYLSNPPPERFFTFCKFSFIILMFGSSSIVV